jgi:hypothetical protein
MRRCHMYLYASVPDFILQNNLAAKIMLFNLPVNNLSYRIEFWLFVDNRLLKINLLADGFSTIDVESRSLRLHLTTQS